MPFPLVRADTRPIKMVASEATMGAQRSIRAVLHVGVLALVTAVLPIGLAAEEHILFTNGFELNCVRHETQVETGKVRIYSSTQPSGDASAVSGYLEVAASSIRLIEAINSPAAVAAVSVPTAFAPGSIQTWLADAGVRHHIDVDLLAALVHAESGGHVGAVSRTGARGLMQLMPATAASLGVQDAFQPDQNIAGGTAYLDQLLTRFHDDITLALAAYNAGPAAVDRWHGIPPYRETRAYVARIVSEYNRRKKTALAAVATH